MSLNSYYVDERRAALAGRAYYDTRVGPGYDLVPIPVIYNGFGETFDDKRYEEAGHDPLAHKNTPQLRQSLYEGHRDDGLPHMGYYRWPEERAALDMAPDFVKARVPQVGQIGRCINAHLAHEQPMMMNTNVFIAHAGQRQRDYGNPIGVLYDPPATGPKKQGNLFPVPGFY